MDAGADVAATDGSLSDRHAAPAPDACPWSDVSPGDAASAEDVSTDGGCTVGDASGIVCPQSLASYCHGCPPLAGWSRFSACDSTWQSVTANPPCDVDTQLPVATCPGSDILGFSFADTAFILVYDAPSGRLVAVLGSSPSGLACQAGPACLPFPPNGCAIFSNQNLSCGDAGG
jgi:hypothetical protein